MPLHSADGQSLFVNLYLFIVVKYYLIYCNDIGPVNA